jgi:predicted nuclease of predicted toxin-antitoxin system
MSDPIPIVEELASEDLPEPVKGTEFTTADRYDPKVMASAYEAYLTTDLDLNDIAIMHSVPPKVVALWARRGGWAARRKEVEEDLFRSAEDKYRALIIKHRAPVIERHLRVAGKIEDAVEKAVDALGEYPTARALKPLAEALSSAANVSARAAAISETPFSDSAKENKNKRPLIMIGVTPTADGGANVRVQEAEYEEVRDESSPNP